MKRSDIPDPHIKFKRYFVLCVNDYLQDPTDRKQAKLKDLVQKSIHLDQDLLFWFNAMFTWRNTRYGLTVDFKNKPSIPS